MTDKKVRLSIPEARSKIERYCAYQERCHKEVSDKLYTFGLNSSEVAELQSEMVKKGFLNEERFARAFAGGKFRQKKWGRKKIIHELKLRQISAYCINKAMSEIDDDVYNGSLQKTAEKYASKVKAGSNAERKQKTLKYLLGKGYEYDVCQEILRTISL